MPFGLDESWVMAPPDVHNAGRTDYAATIGIPATHPLVGGPTWGSDNSGMGSDTGLSRLVTDAGSGGDFAAAGSPQRKGLDDWRDIFNFAHSPTPWVLLALLIAVGFIHLRLNTRVGPAHAKLGLG